MLPVKMAVQKSEKIGIGDRVQAHMSIKIAWS